MSPRSEVAWEAWEKKHLSPGWTLIGHCRGNPAPMDIMNNIRWTEASSLRGKKYHILRKQRRTGSGSPKHAAHRNRAGACRSVGHKASLANLTSRRPAQSNIEKCFQTILRTEPSHIDSIESAKTKDSRPGRAMPLLRPSRREETRSSSQI
ncbi:hypothetical protein EN45_061740 [Penicillium chrysogenum]|uniref:Uncharacterized protein n=1 Tax=Penicillium chrysogenum TaxID=5076 RepID=A0A167SWC4_PENCH|nr:hypothetical protein EN45_061740 [Penicillium chrysogenum]